MPPKTDASSTRISSMLPAGRVAGIADILDHARNKHCDISTTA